MTKPLFITFEGGEGGGKTTQAELLSNWMKDRNISHCLTKEPGDPKIAECAKLRKLLLDPENDLVPSSELFLFLADRAQHVEKLIKPEMKAGNHVICDRYTDSTRVYQIAARGFSRTKLDPLLVFATGGLMPDITFLLDVPVDVGLERARAKSIYKDGDRMERENAEYHEKVRQGFLRLATSLSEQGRVVRIDAAPPKTIEEVHNEVVKHISKRLWFND